MNKPTTEQKILAYRHIADFILIKATELQLKAHQIRFNLNANVTGAYSDQETAESIEEILQIVELIEAQNIRGQLETFLFKQSSKTRPDEESRQK